MARSMTDSEIFDPEENKKIRSFRKLYLIFGIVLCISLAVLFIVSISELPDIGADDNPAVNEVVERYLERGLKETGAVNIVAGMILITVL